jgi:phage gp29-like protein
MRFWLQFAEKYGGAFLIGKLPRGTENAEWVKLQSSLENLIQNGVGVIADDSSIAPLEAGGKQASTDLYERLVMYCRSEISIVLTGTNQTVEVSANKASAYAGMDVAGDLRDANARMVETMVNRLIRWTVDLNWPGAPAPVFTMWDQQNRDAVQAARDKSNFEAGARFTKSFWVANYGYRDTDLVDVRTPPPDVPALPGAKPPGPRNAIAFAAAASLTAADKPDPTAALQDQLGAAAAPAWGTLLDQVGALVQAAPDLATLQTTLVDAYGGLDTAALTKLMAAAFALAELQGMVAAQADAAAGGA